MSDWIEAAYTAMTAQPHFFLWPRDPMPIVVYGYDIAHVMLPPPILYSYVVLPWEAP